MWKTLFASAVGTSHQLTGKPCQDYCGGRVVGLGADAILIAACADGAGSAEHSQIGARLAVETLLAQAETYLRAAPGVRAMPDLDRVKTWVKLAREAVFAESRARGLSSRELASTLLAALAGSYWSVFLQIGDGVIVREIDHQYYYVFWPTSGEYTNTTHFLTDPDYEGHVRYELCDAPATEIALLTDGLQMLALDYADQRVFGGFFRPMFETLRGTEDVDSLRENLARFLGSKRVNDRTDDDKTLMLATRRALTDHAGFNANEAV